jgi:hypothetical protein
MLLALHNGDRAALLAAADRPPAPQRFSGVLGEMPHHGLLRELGLSSERAGLEVVASRSHQALHALRDLDRGLGREGAFLRGAGREDDAGKLERARDGLRRAYDAAARCVVEKLFALTLLGRVHERDALVQASRPILPHRPKALGDLSTARRPRGRCSSSRCCRSEVAFLESPGPRGLPAFTTVLVEVTSRRKTEQAGAMVYDGDIAHPGLVRWDVVGSWWCRAWTAV